MDWTYLVLAILTLLMVSDLEGKKISKSRSSGSGRGSSRKTNYNPQPAPTSFSYPQPSAPKPSLFGWQEKSAPKQTLSSSQQKPSSGHSYPSSHTGLSGNNQPKSPPVFQENIQRSNVPTNLAGHQTPARTGTQLQTNNQPSHSYPSSNGLSGSSSAGAGYPHQQGSGLSGAGAPPPAYPGHGTGAAPPPYPGHQSGASYSGGHYPNNNNFGNNYQQHHPQGAPPPYSTPNHGYSGYNGHGYQGPGYQGAGYSPQMPGYFGNYGNSGKGFGGVSRTGSALTGVGIAGAGIGTVLTGLALWNLARSTGHHHHTVIYDNRGQPVAVAPVNSTTPAVDPILADLVNCTLTISSSNATEVLAIPCSIATSFTPEAEVKDLNTATDTADSTKCTVTVVTKAGKEFMTTIPCSILLNSAAENNVTEPPPLINDSPDVVNSTMLAPNDLSEPSALKYSSENAPNVTTSLNCTVQPDDVRDPINPCFAATHNLTVIPLPSTEAP